MKTMNIFALPGHKVMVTEKTVNNGYEFDKEQAKPLLGKILTVHKTCVHQSSTNVFLEEYPGQSFNSVNFEDVDKQSTEQNKLHPDYQRFKQGFGL